MHNVRVDAIWLGTGALMPNPGAIAHLASEAEDLADKYLAAAIVACWSALEGALQLFCLNIGIPVFRQSGTNIEALYSRGEISTTSYKRLQAIRHERNVITHGPWRVDERTSAFLVKHLARMAQGMANGSIHTVPAAIKILVKSYEEDELRKLSNWPAEETDWEVMQAANRALPLADFEELAEIAGYALDSLAEGRRE
jgi:hypothetical protein